MIGKTERLIGRKVLFLIILLSTPTLTYLGCGGGLKVEGKNVEVKEWKKVDAKHFGHRNVQALTVSRDGKNVYVTAFVGAGFAEALYHGDAGNLKDDWSEIKLSGLDGSAAGKASFAVVNTVSMLSPTNHGVLVSLNPDLNGGPNNGIIAIRGKEKNPEAAWKSTTQDMDTVDYAAVPPANKLITSTPVFGTLVVHKDVEVPYVMGFHHKATKDAANRGRLGAVTKADLSPTQFNAVVKRDGASFDDEHTKLINSPEYLFAIDKLGITTMPAADIGTAKDFLNIPNSSQAPTTDGVVGADAFQMKMGVPNTTVKSVIISNNNLFIGLGRSVSSGGDDIPYTGGVAVYEIKPSGTEPKVNKPDENWNGISVLRLIEDDKHKVWAVTANGIMEARPDGKRGEDFLDASVADLTYEGAKDGYIRETFPDGEIKEAEFVNGDLVVNTKKGLYVVEKTMKPVRSRQVVEEGK